MRKLGLSAVNVCNCTILDPFLTPTNSTRYGVKNKGTTEQAFFNCNICECELKSVVTLRAHCKGTQHVRKALQKKKVQMKICLLFGNRI